MAHDEFRTPARSQPLSPLMAQAPRQLPLRVWCGAFPLFAQPSVAASDACDVVSTTFFASDAFSRLRMRLRLKLLETSPLTQTRRATYPATHYSELLALADQYEHYVVALLQYANVNKTLASTDTPYEPLFFGWGETDLSNERLVGREHRLVYAVPVDAVLTLVLQGQLHVLHADALVEQGLTLQSEPIAAAAETAWRASTWAFERAANFATESLHSSWRTGDPQVATLVKLFTGLTTQCSVLARVSQMHRAATRITCLMMLDETTERLARNAAVCARYASTVATEVCAAASDLDDSSFSRQLVWLVRCYAIRWRAILYTYEQTILQLDFHPEIAIHFGEMIHRGERLPPLPALGPRRDAVFTRVAHELQQSHTAHLHELLETKSALLTLCHRKLGPLWTLQLLPRELHDAMETVPAFHGLFADDEDEPFGWIEQETGVNVDELLTVEAICRHVQSARERAGGVLLSSSYLKESVENHCQETTLIPTTRPSAADNTIQQHTIQQSSPEHTTAWSTKTSDGEMPQAIVRPSSAGTPHKLGLGTSHSVPSSDWVTMRMGDKVLHFEPLLSPATTSSRPPRPSTANAIVSRRRNAVPMITDDDVFAAYAVDPLKPRPSSSPSHRRPAKDSGKALTWVPTRASCALCERRFTRSNLPGVVVMKRIFDLRRKWGMVLHDSKKFSAASALYNRASVCVLCQDILTFEDDKDAMNNHGQGEVDAPLDDIGVLIRTRIQQTYVQLPPPSGELLLDVAVDKRARQSSTNFGLAAQNAVRAEPMRTAHTKEEFQPWWEVDLGNYHVIHSIKVWLREDTSHVFGYGGGQSTSGHPHRKMGIDVPANAIPLSSIGFLQSGAGPGLACGALAPAPLPNVGLYPLHISVSMKTGMDRDLGDVVASAVSSYCASAKAVQPITWLTPPNCRGRFVRIQSESTAFLHIEKVNVFVAQEPPLHAARRKREQARSTLKRAAFRASVISKRASTSQVSEVNEVPVQHPDSPTGSTTVPPERRGSAGAFANPEQAEKRRVSRLYLKFKGLLDARSKYVSEDLNQETD